MNPAGSGSGNGLNVNWYPSRSWSCVYAIDITFEAEQGWRDGKAIVTDF